MDFGKTVASPYKQDNEVVFLDQLYRMYVERGQAERSRMQENHKFYSALNHGQWTPSAVAQHIQERRTLSSFNFIKSKIDTLAGSFLQDPYDAAFEADGNGPNADALLMQTLFMSDKEYGGWEYEKSDFILDGLIHTGIMEMTVDYSRSPLGNVALKHSNPFDWWFDPNWTTKSVKDNKRIIKTRWMDAEDIRMTYSKKIEQIDEAVNLWTLTHNTNSGDAEIDKVADRSAEYYDSYHHRYKVIQVMQIRREAVKQLWDSEERKFLPMMDKVNTLMMKHMGKGRYKEVIHKTEICWVKTICPGLSMNLLLEDGPHPLYLPCYPLFVWSATNLHGERQGFVDIMKDPQMTYNKRESTYTHAQTTAVNGALLIEANFFDKGERERFMVEKNIPGSQFVVKDGTITNGRMGMAQVPREKLPTDMVESAERAHKAMHELTPTPPSVTGGEGKSGESAKLFIEKKETALTALVPTNIGIQRVDKEICETYFDAAKGAPREFKNPKTKVVVTINMRTMDGVQNDVSKVQRANVIITKSKAGHSLKREKVNTFMQVGQYVKNPMLASLLEGEMIDGIPGFTDDVVAQARELSNLYITLQVGRVKSEIAQLRMAEAQAAMATSQMGASPQAAPGTSQGAPSGGSGQTQQLSTGPSEAGRTPADGGGFSVEGKKIPPSGGLPVDVMKQNQLQQ
jgi:hypothetical protein